MPHNDPNWPLRRYRLTIRDDALHFDPTSAFRVSFNFGSEVRFEALIRGHREMVSFRRHGVLLLPGAVTPVLRQLGGHGFGPRADGKHLFSKMLLLEVHRAVFEAAAHGLALPDGELEELGPLTLVMDDVALRLAEALRTALAGDAQPPRLLAPIAEAMARWLLLRRDRAIAPSDLPPRPASAPCSRGAAMDRVIKRIDTELDQKLPLQSLADSAGMSRSHFLRAFKQSTGLTPHRYVVQARVARAQQLIEATLDAGREVRLGVIAHDAGFASHSQFSAVFRERVGVSPSLWLANAQHAMTLSKATSE